MLSFSFSWVGKDEKVKLVNGQSSHLEGGVLAILSFEMDNRCPNASVPFDGYLSDLKRRVDHCKWWRPLEGTDWDWLCNTAVIVTIVVVITLGMIALMSSCVTFIINVVTEATVVIVVVVAIVAVATIIHSTIVFRSTKWSRKPFLNVMDMLSQGLCHLGGPRRHQCDQS